MRTRRRPLAALVALAAMFFAQAAFALAACNPVQAQWRAHMIVQQAETAPCHQPAENANLCFAHCQSAEQTLDKHQVKVPEAPFVALAPAPAWGSAPRVARETRRIPAPAAGPPPRILFRTLLI